MKGIYKKKESKKKVLELYENQIEKLGILYEDVYVDTSFGKTHIIKTGNKEGRPLLLLHGGNSTSAYNLLKSSFLLKDFLVYAVDIIGHPGKSEEITLPSTGYSYGKWASQVIGGLGYNKMLCCAGSFGAGVLAKLMCYYPSQVERCVLIVPSGISNEKGYKNMRMAIPILMYLLTGKEEYLIKCIMPMAITEENIDADTYDTVKNSIDHVKVKTGMPSNVRAKDMQKCKAPTLVMAAEKDCLFPAKQVLERAERIIPHYEGYLLKDRGHLHELTEEEENRIIDFLQGETT